MKYFNCTSVTLATPSAWVKSRTIFLPSDSSPIVPTYSSSFRSLYPPRPSLQSMSATECFCLRKCRSSLWTVSGLKLKARDLIILWIWSEHVQRSDSRSPFCKWKPGKWQTSVFWCIRHKYNSMSTRILHIFFVLSLCSPPSSLSLSHRVWIQ